MEYMYLHEYMRYNEYCFIVLTRTWRKLFFLSEYRLQMCFNKNVIIKKMSNIANNAALKRFKIMAQAKTCKYFMW